MEDLSSLPALPGGKNPEDVFSESSTAYNSYPVDNLSWFSLDDIVEKRLTKIGTRVQIWECETDRCSLYLIEPLVEHQGRPELYPGSNDEAARGVVFSDEEYSPEMHPLDKERYALRERGYRAAQLLGIPTPPHAFEEGWIASVEGPLSIREWEHEYPDKESPSPINADEFGTDLAKLLAIGNLDLNRGNILFDSSGEYSFIDMEINPVSHPYRMLKAHGKAGALFAGSGVDETVVYDISRRAAVISEWLGEHLDLICEDSDFRDKLQHAVTNTSDQLPIILENQFPQGDRSVENSEVWSDLRS